MQAWLLKNWYVTGVYFGAGSKPKISENPIPEYLLHLTSIALAELAGTGTHFSSTGLLRASQ